MAGSIGIILAAIPRLFMRAKVALVLHLGGVGKCGRLIWVWSVQIQESSELHTLAATFIMWGNNGQ